MTHNPIAAYRQHRKPNTLVGIDTALKRFSAYLAEQDGGVFPTPVLPWFEAKQEWSKIATGIHEGNRPPW